MNFSAFDIACDLVVVKCNRRQRIGDSATRIFGTGFVTYCWSMHCINSVSAHSETKERRANRASGNTTLERFSLRQGNVPTGNAYSRNLRISGGTALSLTPSIKHCLS